jgi:hypothetical protein
VSFLLKNVPDIFEHGKNYGLKSHEMSVLKIGPPTILWIIEACQILSKVAPLETPGLSREVTSRILPVPIHVSSDWFFFLRWIIGFFWLAVERHRPIWLGLREMQLSTAGWDSSSFDYN